MTLNVKMYSKPTSVSWFGIVVTTTKAFTVSRNSSSYYLRPETLVYLDSNLG